MTELNLSTSLVRKCTLERLAEVVLWEAEDEIVQMCPLRFTAVRRNQTKLVQPNKS